MVSLRLSRDSHKKTDSGSSSNHSAGNGGEALARISTSGDSNVGGSPLQSPKRPPRFRLSSLKQLGAATRAEIRASVRNDWDWPLPEPSPSSPSLKKEDVSGGAGGAGGGDSQDSEDGGQKLPCWSSRVEADTPFVERTPGSDESDIGTEEDEDEDLGHARYLVRNGGFAMAYGSPLLSGSLGGATKSNGVNGHARKASISSSSGTNKKALKRAALIEAAAAARKERRRKRLQDELSWNEGLQTFEARRNAWTGSVLRSSDTAREKSSAKEDSHVNGKSAEISGETAAITVDKARKSESSDVSAPSTNGHPSNGSNQDTRKSSESTSRKSGKDESVKQGSTSTIADDELVVCTPKPAPIIPPDHPVRKEITPATYPQIYSRVVVQGTTPNLPINLIDMTSILVAGWKADDQWPPKPAGPLDPLVGRRKVREANNNGVNGGGHSRNVSGSGKDRSIYKGIKKVFRMRNDKEERLIPNAAALLEA